MGAYEQRLWTLGVRIQCLDDVVQSIGDAVVECLQRLAIHRRADQGRRVGPVEVVGEVVVQNVQRCGRGMVEAGQTVEFTQAIFNVDQDFVVVRGALCIQCLDSGRQGLQAAVKGAAVNDIYRRVKVDYVSGKLLGLPNAVSGERGVGWDACGCGQIAVVSACCRIDDPVGAELARDVLILPTWCPGMGMALGGDGGEWLPRGKE